MRLLEEILEFNQSFVEEKKYEPFIASRLPSKKYVVLSCMDTRLVELLPASMDIKNGDVKLLKTAGAMVTHPLGGIMRSILVAVYELGAQEVFVIGHHDCGMSKIDTKKIEMEMLDRGIKEETLSNLEFFGVNLEQWLSGFSSVEESIKNSVNIIRNHPLLPEIPVHGLIIHPITGKLDVVIDGYKVEAKQADLHK